MPGSPNAIFAATVWDPALEKFGAVTHLAVAVYDPDLVVVCPPARGSALFDFFQDADADPELFATCARRCLAEPGVASVLIESWSGMAAVGALLRLDGVVVGVAVAGYALVDFCQSAGVAHLARRTGVPFKKLWDIARRQQPVPSRRLVLHGELLQVLGDSLLRENMRTRQSEALAAQLTLAAAAKDDFLAMLSHELRTPLTPIIGWARLLKTAPGSTEVAHAADVIERNGQLQVRLVEDLLELARSRRGRLSLELSVRELGGMMHAAVQGIEEIAHEKAIAVDLRDASTPVYVSADPDRLQQIFRNLLVNSVKFTPHGGCVTVTVSADPETATIEVCDTGRGISPAFLPFVFDMFRQQDGSPRRVHGGLGIGLALVKVLTEAHGGQVSIASEGMDQGTTVTIRLPRVSEALAATPSGH